MPFFRKKSVNRSLLEEKLRIVSINFFSITYNVLIINYYYIVLLDGEIKKPIL